MNTIAVLGPTHGSQFFLLSPNNLFPVKKLSCLPLKSLPTKPSKYVRLKAMTSPTCDEQTSHRKFEKLLPSPWTHRFHSVSVDVTVSLYIHTQTHTHVYICEQTKITKARKLRENSNKINTCFKTCILNM